ncbi:hypothetical protein [Bradyrhizobium sp. USDA 3315]
MSIATYTIMPPWATQAIQKRRVYAGFLVYSWRAGVPTTAQASLGLNAIPSGSGLYVIATILGACFLSFGITHLLYLEAVRREIGALIRRLRPVSAWPALSESAPGFLLA